ncbi:hypothetical protein [Alteribacillus iranensis]|uniref:Heat induced stress protein YflT n=1 Tax=Alteribacillus iranensis TaxID=930128 RepID=A0A1I2E535_9BACI|nr:hypothetical protein [Alteribacillus iranensis]SFE87360.1 Heat induced stress protein YflT [Alteribacillus iranensis]
MSTKMIGGVFEEQHDAVLAIKGLKEAGYTTNDISIFTRNDNVLAELEQKTGTVRLDDGAKTGKSENIDKFAVSGVGGGGLLGAIAGLGLLAVPGIGPVVGGGPLAAALSGAGIGAGGGGIIGALTGAGIPDEKAKDFEGYMKEGYILVLVEADEKRERTVYDIFSSHHDVEAREFKR